MVGMVQCRGSLSSLSDQFQHSRVIEQTKWNGISYASQMVPSGVAYVHMYHRYTRWYQVRWNGMCICITDGVPIGVEYVHMPHRCRVPCMVEWHVHYHELLALCITHHSCTQFLLGYRCRYRGFTDMLCRILSVSVPNRLVH